VHIGKEAAPFVVHLLVAKLRINSENAKKVHEK
jgi:hypothetical protein